jgi:hypothetical protein
MKTRKHRETIDEHIDRIKTLATLAFAENMRHDLAIRELKDRYNPGWREREAHEFALKHPDLVRMVKEWFKGRK